MSYLNCSRTIQKLVPSSVSTCLRQCEVIAGHYSTSISISSSPAKQIYTCWNFYLHCHRLHIPADSSSKIDSKATEGSRSVTRIKRENWISRAESTCGIIDEVPKVESCLVTLHRTPNLVKGDNLASGILHVPHFFLYSILNSHTILRKCTDPSPFPQFLVRSSPWIKPWLSVTC